MKIKFSKVQYEYIESNLLNERQDLIDSLPRVSKEESMVFEIGEEEANEIRDWAIDKQTVVGFDENYELNEEGKILQQVIDILCF